MEEVIHCFIHGTNDLKALLLQSCNLIFECRSCRELFRSLPDFVKHIETKQCQLELNPNIEQKIKPEENPRLLKILSWKENSMLNGNRFVNNCSDNFDEPSPDILEERLPTPVINEPIEEHSPVMDVENSFFVNPEAAPRSCAPTASRNPPPRLTEPTSSVAFEEKLPAEGEQIIVTGPICPVCGKSFATKNNCRRHVREMHGMTPISKKRAQNGHGVSAMDDSRNGFHQNGELGENDERECPSCGITTLDADSLRRHLIDDHRFSYMDACSIVAKETPLGCNSLPTLVTPTSLQQEIPTESSLNCSKRKAHCPLCKLVLFDRWMARKHLIKQHGKDDAESEAILARCFPENSPEESKTNNQKDPDTIACPICHKDWHKSNLRNHLFYGHHMKTAEVEAALLKIRNPKSGLKTESIKNDRTPCPLCERSFKHWYNARRHLREGHGIEHEETVRMIRPPSELRRKKIDSLITEASETKAITPPETAGSSQESLVPADPSTEEFIQPENKKSPEIGDDEGELQIADDEIQELPLDEDDEEIDIPREAAKKPRTERTELVQFRTGSIVKVKVLPGSFQEVGNKKCSHCHLILSSRVSMKQHVMENHMIVYEDDQEWQDLKIDNKQAKTVVIMEEKAEAKSGEEWRCPICREVKTTESALRYHLRQTHKKKRQEVDNLVEIGKDENQRKKRRLQSPERELSYEVKAPIISNSLSEDSHFLLSSSTTRKEYDDEIIEEEDFQEEIKEE